MAAKDDWAGFEEPAVEVVPSRQLTKYERKREAIAHKREEMFQRIESELVTRAMAVTLGACRFAEIPPAYFKRPEGAPDEWEPPIWQPWVDEGIPADIVRAMMRAAASAWLTKKDSPVGLVIAQTTFLGMAKVEAMRNSGPKVLNAEVAQIVVTDKNPLHAAAPTVRVKVK